MIYVYISKKYPSLHYSFKAFPRINYLPRTTLFCLYVYTVYTYAAYMIDYSVLANWRIYAYFRERKLFTG